MKSTTCLKLKFWVPDPSLIQIVALYKKILPTPFPKFMHDVAYLPRTSWFQNVDLLPNTYNTYFRMMNFSRSVSLTCMCICTFSVGHTALNIVYGHHGCNIAFCYKLLFQRILGQNSKFFSVIRRDSRIKRLKKSKKLSLFFQKDKYFQKSMEK